MYQHFHSKDRKLKRDNYTSAAAALRKRVRTTLTELEIHLERDSQLWAAFGLTSPAFKARRRAKIASAKTTDSAPPHRRRRRFHVRGRGPD